MSSNYTIREKPIQNLWRMEKNFRPRGHAFFTDSHDRGLAIADCSGDYPDQTDDGVLYVATGLPIRITQDETCRVSISLSLRGQLSAPISTEELVWLVNEHGMSVCIGRHPESTLLQGEQHEEDCD